MANLPAPEITPDFADELVGRLADVDQLAATRAAMAKLRRPEREVFALCVWSGLDPGMHGAIVRVTKPF